VRTQKVLHICSNETLNPIAKFRKPKKQRQLDPTDQATLCQDLAEEGSGGRGRPPRACLSSTRLPSVVSLVAWQRTWRRGSAGSLEQRKGKQRGSWMPVIGEGGASRTTLGSWTPAVGVNHRRHHASLAVGLELGDARIWRGGPCQRWDCNTPLFVTLFR
jgi:hypothetical protein